MKVKVIYLGRKDEPWVASGVQHYLGRLKHYVSLENVKVHPPKTSNSLSKGECQRLESQALQTAVVAGTHVVSLDKGGKSLSSEAFAHMLGKLQSSSHRALTFVIGGAFGLSDRFLKESNAVISLSAMTFPHQLARLVFLEQLYRAFTILKGESYHHA